MSGNPYDQQNQDTTPGGNNYFGVFNALNTLVDPGFPISTQPNFGQYGSPPALCNMPWPNQNFSSPFQPGLTDNHGFFQNQQSSIAEYAGDDDFYDNDENDMSNSPTLAVDSNERSNASLTSQANILPTLESVPKTPARTTLLRPQMNNVASTTPGATNPTNSSHLVTKDRASELREKLLASKRANSATPIPSGSNNNRSAAIIETTKQVVTPNHDFSSQNTAKDNEVNVNASTAQTVTAKSKDKSLPNISEVSTSTSTHADVQGLIDHYRASEVVKDPESALDETGKGDTPKGSSKAKPNGAASRVKGDEEAGLLPTDKSNSAKRADASPGSSESGEIRSEQSLETSTNALNQAQSATEASKSRPPADTQNHVVDEIPNKPQVSKTQREKSRTSKPKVLSATPKQDPHTQSAGSRPPAKLTSISHGPKSVKRIDSIRNGSDQSPSPRMSSGNHSQRRFSEDWGEKIPDRYATTSSVPTGLAHPQASPTNDLEVRKHREESAQGFNKKRAIVPEEQVKEQDQPPSLPQAVSSANNNPPKKQQKKLHENPGLVGPDSTVELTSHKSQQLMNHVSPDAAPYTQGAMTLSLSQQEQIQKLGIDLSPQGLTDLYEFLEYHRFFVKEYREGFLTRQRRLKALEAEKVALERESLMQYELFNSMRAQSLAAREYTEPPALIGLQELKENVTPSTKPMAPPLGIPKKPSDESMIAIKGRASNMDAHSSHYPTPQANGDLTSRVVQDGSSLKRQHFDNDEDINGSRKMSRIDSDAHHSDWSQQISPKTSRTEHQVLDSRRNSDFAGADLGYRGGRSRSPNNRRRSLSPYREASDYNYPPRQNSWTASYNRGRDQPRPSDEELRRNPSGNLCRNCHRVGHFSADCPDAPRASGSYGTKAQRREDDDYHSNRALYSSRGKYSSSTMFPGGSRGRAGYESYKPNLGPTSHKSRPAHYGALDPKGSESLNLKAGGQSRSTSISADLP